MRIVEVTENKKQYLDLLLLADEQEDMVDRYLYKGKMHILDDDGVKCECVVTQRVFQKEHTACPKACTQKGDQDPPECVLYHVVPPRS